MNQPTLDQPTVRTPMTARSRFVSALRRRAVDRPPVWFMRQAGRHLPGYRTLREHASFLDLCRDEQINVEASCEPWRRYGVDAVIVFNDILIPLRDMGLGMDFAPGPRFERLISSRADAASLDTPSYGGQTDVCRCLSAIRTTIADDAGLLGFIGAPFTVAAFAVAGAGSQRSGPLDRILAGQREALEALSERLVGVLAEYAAAQAGAGADAIQIFESLGDGVDEMFYRGVGLPLLMELIERVRTLAPQTPVIVFGRGMWPWVDRLGAAGVDAISLDETRPLAEARDILRGGGVEATLQGNLESAVLNAGPESAASRASDLLARWRGIVPDPGRAASLGPTGWVFNLGHGVPRDADPESVQAVVDTVKRFEFNPAEPAREEHT